MQIVSDRGADLSPEQMEGLNIHFAPLRLTLDGQTYESGVNISPAEFSKLLLQTDSFPITSQPSAGDFVQLYRKLAETDPEILSVHISSGLSGTLNSAKQAAAMVPEAHVKFVDTKTLSAPEGWQVEVAARAALMGMPVEQIQEMLNKIRQNSEGLFTLNGLKYLIHGGRISHMKGLIASLLNIKPIIGVEQDRGTYISHGQEVTLKRALNKMVDVVAGIFPGVGQLRVQLLHGDNPGAVEYLRERMQMHFDIRWDPVVSVAPVLVAHTGPSLVGLAVGPASVFD